MNPVLKVAAGLIAVTAASLGSEVAPSWAAQPVPAESQALNAQTAVSDTGPHAPAAVAEGGGIRLRSVGVDLPAEGRAFPPGPGVALVAGNCTSCHTPGMILNQPALTRADWTSEVNKMIHAYKAPVDEADVPAIVTYLVSLKVAP